MDKLNYQAHINCYNGAYSDFDFHAGSLELARDHINSLLKSPLTMFDWENKFPDQIHYIMWKSKSSVNYRYSYTKDQYSAELSKNCQPPFKELYKAWVEYTQKTKQ